MSRIKVGLIGCGRVAQRIHLNVLSALPEARVVAVAEPNARRRQEAGKAIPQAQLFSDYRVLLSESDAEAVLICLPSSLHAEATLAAFEAGTHVYVEKPGATSRAEAEAVVEAWSRSGRVATMGLNFRFHPLYMALRDEVQAGRVGEPVAVRSVF